MKTQVSILENKDTAPSLSLNKSKIIVIKVPKALIIKLEDISPHELYSQMKEKTITRDSNEQLSDWYMNNRQHCVNYIRKCCDRLKLRDNSFFAALSYADGVLMSSNKLTTKTYDLIVISCIVLATKYAENDAYELDLNNFHTSEGTYLYNMHDIKAREVKTIKELQYDLNISTAYDFLVYQMACGVIFKDEFPDKRNVNKFYSYSKSLLIQVVSTNLGIIYSPEVISLCVITLSRNYFELNKNRMNNVKDKLNFNQNDTYNQCLQDISKIIPVSSTFSNKNTISNKKSIAKNPLYLSNPELLSQYRRNTIRNKLQITPRTTNTNGNTVKKQTNEKKSDNKTNFKSKKKPLDSTCSSINQISYSIFDSIKVPSNTNIIKPKNMSSNALFNFKSNHTNENIQKFILTNCDLPIISSRK